MSAPRWWIHLTHPGGETSISFTGLRNDAEIRAERYIGKPASWDCRKEPHTPNMWDCYSAWRIEEVVERAE